MDGISGVDETNEQVGLGDKFCSLGEKVAKQTFGSDGVEGSEIGKVGVVVVVVFERGLLCCIVGPVILLVERGVDVGFDVDVDVGDVISVGVDVEVCVVSLDLVGVGVSVGDLGVGADPGVDGDVGIADVGVILALVGDRGVVESAERVVFRG
eukprot:TRINITY_DN3291_c0_g1_i5.p3 TRINITY_DN3291_c0_g1~~TRINITY_DN3291_c0_g1_i5.p3  ORF type:complete len:153 (+),score=66.63 TRINITY_DN3291_c0_g1_i5:90-548(+)